eukprot:16235-Heterococcus_DN1.PRE.2
MHVNSSAISALTREPGSQVTRSVRNSCNFAAPADTCTMCYCHCAATVERCSAEHADCSTSSFFRHHMDTMQHHKRDSIEHVVDE